MGSLIFQNKGNISWKLVEDLYYNDVEMNGLYLNKKLSYEHVQLTSFSKMKVNLAAQVCLLSVLLVVLRLGMSTYV